MTHSPYRRSQTLVVIVFGSWLSLSPLTVSAQMELDFLGSSAPPPVAPAAADPSSGGEEIVFQNIPSVYGAAKYDQKITEAPASITIITADQIRKYGYRNIPQLLNSVPGFYTTYDRTYDFLGVRGFNRPGDYNSRILLLVDNHRLNDAIFDQAPIGSDSPIDVDLIDRVEIIRGPSSSLYGTNAFFGVINVITKRGKDLKGMEISGEASTFDSFKGRLSYGNKFRSGLEVLLSSSVYTSQGQRNYFVQEYANPATNDGHAIKMDQDDFHNLFGKASYGDISLQGGYLSRNKRVPTAFQQTEFNNGQDSAYDARGYLDLKYQHDLAPDFTLKLRGYYDWYRYKQNYVFSTPAPSTLNQDHDITEQAGIEASVVKRLFDRHRVTLGTEYRDQFRIAQTNKDLSVPATYLDDHRKIRVWALFGQEEWAITDRLLLNVGIRHDHYSSFGGTTNPRVGLIYNWDATTIKLLYGRAFRAPNPFEQFYTTSNTAIANPSIRPERITTYEAVVERSITDHVRATASYYQYQIKGLIDQTTVAGPDTVLGTGDDQTQYQNTGGAHSKGMELTVEGKWPSGLEGRASYALQETHDVATGARLTNSPQNLAKLNLIVPLYGDKLFAGLETRYTGQRTTLNSTQTKEIYQTNLSLFSQRWVKGWEFSGQVNNLFNYKYGDPASPDYLQNTIEQDGRTFWLKLKYRLD